MAITIGSPMYSEKENYYLFYIEYNKPNYHEYTASCLSLVISNTM